MFQLFDQTGSRKYLNAAEREAFLKASEDAAREVRTFCAVLHFTGVRLNEALNLTADRIDLNAQQIVIESLKKRKKGIYRAIPVPASLLDMLDLVHNIKERQRARDKGASEKLWTWSDTTAWRRVKEVMDKAGLSGAQASPKGLRHGYGVHAVQSNVPLNMVQKWMGHADISTTAIYVDAVGEEEQNIAARMWA